jgi:glycosyltransferase involved in cell wall biosynthesis
MDEAPIQVSACVLTCNHAGYIRRCLESVLAQTDDVVMEILIGDDCSDDGTSAIVAEIAAKHPGLITHIRHPARIGGTANYVDIMRRAKAPFIAYLDGDDCWLPGKLKKQLAYLNTHAECLAVYTNAITVTESGNQIGLFNDVGDECFDLPALLRRGNFLNASSAMTRTLPMQAALQIEGPFIDYRVHLRLARKGLLAHWQQPLVCYRVNPAGAVASTSNDFIRDLYWEAIMDVPRDLIADDDLAQGVADFLKRVIFRAIRTKRWALLKQWVPRVFAASPYSRPRTGLLVVASVARSGWKMLIGKFRRMPDGRRLNIMYRR